MNIVSFSPFGFDGSLVTVEVDLRRGIPAVDVVGLADGTVRESRERMRAAIVNSGMEFPPERVLISLSPADLKKEGSGFDLAIALAVLEAKRNLGEEEPCAELGAAERVLVMGELELSGRVRGVRGVHAAAATAAAAGIHKCIVPLENVDEAREAPGGGGMKVFGAASLSDAFTALSDDGCFAAVGQASHAVFVPEGTVEIEGVQFPPENAAFEFSLIRGQARLVRALQIAAAGGHNVLAFGPPGCGKTLAMQRFGELLPLLTAQESQSVTRIHSLAGILPPGQPLVRIPPFRMPHQTASMEGLCGGGARCAPGDISLAHNGVLFLDEAAEFRTSALQMLRVPLESGSVTLSRAGRSSTYPANFQLLLASNPCPCGNFGIEGKVCLCSARSVEMYWKKFSGPLLDRVDMRVRVGAGLHDDVPPQSTAQLRLAVARAVKAQRRRQSCKNAGILPADIARLCTMTGEASDWFDRTARACGLSSRAVASCCKVGRTIADMEQSDAILLPHIKEAVELRRTESAFET